MIIKNLFFLLFIVFCPLGLISSDTRSAQPIDFTVVRDLELTSSLNGTHEGIIASFDHTATAYGKVCLHERFRTLQSNVIELEKMQRGLKFLLEHEHEQKSLATALTSFGKHEAAATKLHNKTIENGTTRIIQNFYFGSSSLDRLNDNNIALDLLHYSTTLGILSPVLEHLIFHYALQYLSNDGHHHHHHDHDHHEEDGDHDHDHHHHTHNAGHTCATDLLNPGENATTFKRGLFQVIEYAHLLIHLWSIVKIAQDLSTAKAVLNDLYQQLCSISMCVKAMQQAHILIKANADLKALVIHENGLSELFEQTEDTSLTGLVEALCSDYFNTARAIGLLSPVGETLRIFRLIQKHTDVLATAYKTLGIIDMTHSIAQHITMHADQKNSFCFAEFIHDTATPHINGVGVWNVALGEKSTHNDLDMGGSKTSKMILTGPNKAGKTGILKTVAYNIILAQNFGIAAARSFKLTPFNKLLTCMIITDDITADRSKFVASLAHAEAMTYAHQQAAPGAKIFVGLDDSLFDGTSIGRREELSYNFVKTLGDFDNNILIVATHLENLTQLETETSARFKNYRIKIDTDQLGKKHSTFTLEPGSAEPNSAFDIIQSHQP